MILHCPHDGELIEMNFRWVHTWWYRGDDRLEHIAALEGVLSIARVQNVAGTHKVRVCLVCVTRSSYLEEMQHEVG